MENEHISKHNNQLSLPSDMVSFRVDHLPVVTAFIRKIGIVETINSLVDSQRHTDPGTIVSAMILNTLCGRSPLYHLEQFFFEQDTELLFGKNIQPERFNDDIVGRTLDDLQQKGIESLFSAISLQACQRMQVNCSVGHFDTTSVNVWGEYKGCGNSPENLQLTHGFSKDHRPDLKQFMFSLLCVEGNIPLMGLPQNGNAADSKLNNKELERVAKLIKQNTLDQEKFTYIADSKLVNKANLKALENTRFITRLPANYKVHDQLVEQAVEANQWQEIGTLADNQSKSRPAAQYKYSEQSAQLYEKNYRAIVIHSSAHDQRRLKRIERQIATEKKATQQWIKDYHKRRFACQEDALREKQLVQKHELALHHLEVEVLESAVYQRGRPAKKADRVPKRIDYRLEIKVQADTQALEQKRVQAGCFVLLTNVPSEGKEAWVAKKILSSYKEQHGVETSFRFLKDPLIVNDLFLKKPERVEALGFILMLSLLVWNLIQRSLRQYIKEENTTLPGWDKKQTTKPTAYMMTWMVRGIIVIKTGNYRRLGNPLNPKTLAYLTALGLSVTILTTPPS